MATFVVLCFCFYRIPEFTEQQVNAIFSSYKAALSEYTNCFEEVSIPTTIQEVESTASF